MLAAALRADPEAGNLRFPVTPPSSSPVSRRLGASLDRNPERQADDPDRTGLPGLATRCSSGRATSAGDMPGWSRTSVLRRRKTALSSTELRASESLRQELNPHLGRTKGACLPLTLRRLDVHGDGGSRTRNLPGASGLLCQLSFIPGLCCVKVRTDGVEPPQREAPRLQRGELTGCSASAYKKGDRPDSNRYREDHDLGCCRYTTATMNKRGRPGSNRRPFA